MASRLIITGYPPGPLFNMNNPPKSRGANIRRSKEVAEWRKAGCYSAMAAIRINKIQWVQEPCNVQVSLPVPNNIRRDPHNYEVTSKHLVDSLVDAGLFVDDNPKWVTVLPTTLHVGKTYVITITPRGDL